MISLFPHLHTPLPPAPLSPSLISLIVSVAVKQHVYVQSGNVDQRLSDVINSVSGPADPCSMGRTRRAGSGEVTVRGRKCRKRGAWSRSGSGVRFPDLNVYQCVKYL